jgi:hypothetical protein
VTVVEPKWSLSRKLSVLVATAKRLLINNAFGVAASYANEAVVAPITLVRWFTAS